MTNYHFLISCSPGLAPLLEEELKEILPEVNIETQSASLLRFEGMWSDAAAVIGRSRIASRLFLSLRIFSAKNPEMLYDQIRRIPWPEFFDTEHTFAVFSHGELEGVRMQSMNFVSLKIKDAICDEFRKHGKERPSVARKNPDRRIEAHFHGGRCEISLSLHGEALHRRGYRKDSGEAPLRENRAAALLRFAKFESSDKSFLDPFCGSGSLAIEAAMVDAKIAPSILRPEKENFVLSGGPFAELNKAYIDDFRKARDEKLGKIERTIFASDAYIKPLQEAQANASRAGVTKHLRFEKRDARTLKLGESFLIVSNPPYGERIEDIQVAKELISDFVRNLKHNCPASELALVLPKGELSKSVGLKPDRKCDVENGPLLTQFLIYQIRAGKFHRGAAQ